MAKLAPPICQQVREGLDNAKPKHEIAKVHTVNIEDEVSEESKQEEKHKYTSAYATCQIGHKISNVIIDTGSGICLCSKPMLDLLGWNIQAPTKLTITVADGHRAVPIGRIFKVPIVFGNTTTVMDMIVVNTTSYDIVLGTDFLTEAKAVIDFNAECMRISSRGQKIKILINIRKGI